MTLFLVLSSLFLQFLNVSTLFWMAYKCLPLVYGAILQTILFPSDLDIFIFTSIFSFLIVCLASLSTLSLPKMPTAGVQISWISLHLSFSLVYVVNISYNRSWWLLDTPVLRLYSAVSVAGVSSNYSCCFLMLRRGVTHRLHLTIMFLSFSLTNWI